MSDDDRLPDMAAQAFEHVYPWTEEEFFALGQTTDRVELFDGSLLVSPASTVRHQRLSRRLANALEPAALDAGLQVDEAVNVRLRPGRVPIPDLVITQPMDLDTLVVEARDIPLICEITSTNVGADRVTKMHYYAEARIPWYLIVDPQGPVLSLYRLDGDHYVEEQTAKPGERLLFTEPIVAEIDPASLAQ
jgi:Uma2 family endonuclease